MAPPIFPNNLWDGKSLERANILIHRPPGPEDWNQIVAEVMALEQYALYLKNLINDFSGGAPGGSNGQLQFNNNGSFAGFNGNVATSDLNGLTDAVAIGSGSFALGEQSLAIGYQCIASTNQSVALGYQCVAGDIPRACIIAGNIITISGDYTDWFYSGIGDLVLSQLSGDLGSVIAYGSIDDTAANNGVIFSGGHTILTLIAPVTTHTAGFVNMRDDQTFAYAEGYSSIASGFSAHAEGYVSTASGGAAHVEGYSSTASGDTSHAEGQGSTASGSSSHAEGQSTTASGSCAHAEGQSSIALGVRSHAEGFATTSSGGSSHAEGYATDASGFASHAEGQVTIASGPSSYAGGTNSHASLSCQWARSDGNIPGQIGHVIVSGRTTSETPVSLLIGGTDALTVPTNQVRAFVADITAYKIDGSKFACFLRRGLIANVAGTTSLIGSINTIGTDINTAGWTVSITANDTTDSLVITVTGEDAVNWRARVDLVEVGI